MKKKSTLLFLFLLIVFSLFFLYRLTEIGPEYDEALFVNAALGCPNPKMFLHLFYPISNTCLPVMVMPYLGATQSYFLRFAFEFLGASLQTMRILNFLLILSSFLIIYQATKKLFNKKVAIIALGLLTFHPQLLLVSRYDRAFIAPFFLRSVLFYAIVYSSSRYNKYKPFVVGFLAGFIVYTKLDSTFLLLSLALAVIPTLVIHKLRVWKKADLNILFRKTISFFIGLLVGAAPLLLYAGKSLTIIVDTFIALAKTRVPGSTMLNKAHYLYSQFSTSQLIEVVFRQQMPHLEAIYLSVIFCIIFVYILIKSWKKTYVNTLLTFTTIIFFVFIFVFRSLGAQGRAHHIFLIYPIPQLLIASYLAQKKHINLAIVAIITLSLTFIISFYDFHKLSELTCGRKNWSCTVREIPGVLTDKKPVVVGDWGLATQILLLTGDKKEIDEFIFEADQSPPDHVKAKMNIFKEGCYDFVMFTPEFTRFLVGAEEIRKNVNKDPRYHKTIIQNRENQDFIEIYKCK